MKKGGFLRNVLDTIRSNQNERPAGGGGGGAAGGAGQTRWADFGGQLKPQHLALSRVAQHGFPEQPSALAFDPVQRIAAIGTRTGAIRVFGRPGVDVWAQHKPASAVTHLRFVVNQGAIITVTADESVHLWSLRGVKLRLQFSGSSSSEAALHSPPPAPVSSSPCSSGGLAAAAAAEQQQAADPNGAQPGDPDYLAGGERVAGASSPGADVSRKPELLHTLRFQREHITCIHQTLHSRWLYIGTERGNVHVANVENFELSGYSIAWNKAIELSRKSHPGSIIHLSECPQDSNKLLIGYETGCIVLWDLKAKSADGRYYQTEALLWLAWHYEGKQFVAAHADGSLITWATRSNHRPLQILFPHAKAPPDQPDQLAARLHQQELFRPINKVDWKVSKAAEQLLLFSGGLPYDGGGGGQEAGKTCSQQHLRSTSLTVMFGKSITVLEMDEPIVDFVTLCELAPYENDAQDPLALIVLLHNDLILIDLTSSGFPSFDSPYSWAQLNESPVTCVQYLADCQTDLIPFLYSSSQTVISRAPKKGFSDKEWPINGGEWGQSMQSYPELVLTGHLDGSIKFWDMSGVNFDLISKIKTAKLFERAAELESGALVYPASLSASSNRPAELEQQAAELGRQLSEGHLFGLDKIEYCSQSKRLLVAGALGQVIQFRLNKPNAAAHAHQELSQLLVEHPGGRAPLKQQLLFRSRPPVAPSGSAGAHRPRPSGFQAELVCVTPLVQLPEEPTCAHLCLAPPKVTALAYQAAHDILAYGHESGIVLVDSIQKCIIMNATLADLYGGASISGPAPGGSANNRDIAIQPFALSSTTAAAATTTTATTTTQHHHYQSAGNSSNICDSQQQQQQQPALHNNGAQLDNNNASGDMQADNGHHHHHQLRTPNSNNNADHELAKEHQPTQPSFTRHSANLAFDLRPALSPHRSQPGAESATTCRKKSQDEQVEQQQQLLQSPRAAPNGKQQQPTNQHLSASSHSLAPPASRFATPPRQPASGSSPPVCSSPSQARFAGAGLFQRQLSTTALQPARPAKPAPRLFQRQLTASQLLAGSSESLGKGAGPGATRRSPLSADEEPRRPARNKRIISRMLSISAIHTSSSQPLSGGEPEPELADPPGSADKPGSFTRSRSSSGSSVAPEREAADSVQCLCFLDWPPPAGHKSLSSIDEQSASSPSQLALWLGTSNGCVLLVGLTLPDTEDNRVLQLQSVAAEPIGHASAKLPGAILCLASFVCESSSSAASVAPAGGPPPPNDDQAGQPAADARRQNSASSGQSSLECKAATFLVVASEKQARVYQVPAPATPSAQENPAKPGGRQPVEWPMARLLAGAGRPGVGNCVARADLSDSSFACRSALVGWRQPEEACLVSFVATGSVVVHSLPRLQLLLDADFVPLSSGRVASSMCFSQNGHCLYLPSATELAKFSLSSQYKSLVNEMTGCLHVQREMPEQPRSNFFRSLFAAATAGGSAASKQSDRDELFGEAGRPQRGVAKHFASSGPAPLDRLKGAALGQELRLAREGLDERGEKLGELEDRTLQMMSQAENYSQAAHQLAQKFKDKKWYQF